MWASGAQYRRELVHYPPVKSTPTRPRSSRYLSEHERVVIADLLAGGGTVRAIAAEIGAHRRPSVGRSAETAMGVVVIARTSQSAPPELALAEPEIGGSLAMSSCVMRLRGFSGNGGARSRSRPNCACGSPVSVDAVCARSRSTRRSMTRRST